MGLMCFRWVSMWPDGSKWGSMGLVPYGSLDFC
jgi:hypothetical protein